MAYPDVLFKLFLLVVAGKSFSIAFTPPNPPAKKIIRGTLFETHVHRIVSVMKQIFWVTMILDGVSTVFLSGLLGPELTKTASGVVGAHMCPNRSARGLSFTSLLASSSFTFCTALIALSALARLWCYRTLGKQFRYEVSLQERHRLVTSGPYAFVRHPSYLALYGTYVGSLGLLAARGTWSRECVLQSPITDIASGNFLGLLEYPFTAYVVLALMGVWFAALLSCERNLAGRLVWEDGLLKDEFGKEWQEYAQRVPWRILPYVF